MGLQPCNIALQMCNIVLQASNIALQACNIGLRPAYDVPGMGHKALSLNAL